MTNACFHCGEPLGRSTLLARIGDRDEAVCCAGCRAVAELISGAGLDRYYEVRTEAPARPDAQSLADDTWSAYSRPEIAASIVHRSGDIDSATLGIEGLRCAACAWLIDKMLKQLDGVVDAYTNAATGRVHVRWTHSQVDLSDVMRTIARAGYKPFPPGDASLIEEQQRERRAGLRHLAISGFGMMQVMMFAIAVYSAEIKGEVIEPQLLEFFRLISMLVAVPVMFYAGLPIFASAWRSLSQRTIGMDVPVALALTLAFCASVWNSFADNGGEVYFDSVTMFIFFVTLGRYVQMSVRHRTTSMTDALARQMPALAHRLNDGIVVDVPVTALAVGDIVQVRRGEVLPADGELLDASASIDESLLTGESTPVHRRQGDAVSGGSLNAGDPIRVRVHAVAEASVLAHIVGLLEKAQSQRPRIAAVADAASVHFLTAVLICATFTALAWAWLDPSRAFPATLAVLVVACPCAFAIAMPAAVSAAVAALARSGVLVTNSDALEKLARVDRAVFDKTGTLTRGELRIARSAYAGGIDESQCRSIAASLEAASEHPIAHAFAELGAVRSVCELHVVPGAGIEGVIDSKRYRIGTPDFVAQLNGGSSALLFESHDGTLILLADETRILAQFELLDLVREGTSSAIDATERLTVSTAILSGDRASAVDAVGESCGIAMRFAGRTPQSKLEHIQSLQQQGHRVLMVGDGINDAPVLAAADVSLAMGRGTALAHASADMILTREDLTAVPQAIDIARRMRRIVRQNLFWSAAYNFGSLPLAALGFIPPWAAALGMSLSSVFVVLNATRLLPRRQYQRNSPQAQRAAVTGIPARAAS